MIRGFRPVISAFCVSFLNNRPRPPHDWHILLPARSTTSTLSCRCPDWVHQVSRNPSTARSDLRIPAVTRPVSSPRTLLSHSIADAQNVPGPEGRSALWLYIRQTRLCLFQDSCISLSSCVCVFVVFLYRMGLC